MHLFVGTGALRHRAFRRFWLALAVSAVGTWMQIVGLAAWVLQAGGGAALPLGLVALAQAAAFLLLSPLAGGLIDRGHGRGQSGSGPWWSRRRLVVACQCASISLALALAALVATGTLRIWMVVLAAFANGAVISLDQPARAAIVADLVPREDLAGAATLQSMLFQLASAVGPAIAGALLGVRGPALLFLLNAVSFLGVLACVLSIRPAGPEPATVEAPPNSTGGVREAIAFLRRDPVLPGVLAVYGAVLFFGPSPALLAPALVSRAIPGGMAVLGPLLSAFGLGALVAALALGLAARVERRERVAVAAALVWSVMLSVLGAQRTLAGAFVSLLFVGAAQAAVGATSISLLQERAPGALRGRLLSLHTLLVMGVRPLGDFPAAAAIDAFGVRVAVFASAAIVALVALVRPFHATHRPAEVPGKSN